MDIKSLINKVIAPKGILRVPSWWMKKLLTEIAGYIDSGDSANKASINRVKNDTDRRITTLESNTNSKITTLESNTNSRITTLESNTNGKITTINNNINTINSTIFEMAKSNTAKIIAVQAASDGNNYIIIDGKKITLSNNSKNILTFNKSFKCYDSRYKQNSIKIWVGKTDVSNVTDMSEMFANYTSDNLDLSSFDTSSVTSMDGMFRYSAITSPDLSSFDTSSVTTMYRMFDGCTSLTHLDLSSFDTSSVTTMYLMFSDCTSLTHLDLSSFDTSSVTNMNMFNNNSSLTYLLLGPNFFKSSVLNAYTIWSSKWTNDTVVTSLVTNSYDRASAGLPTLALWLHANTKAVLSDEQKAVITSKGYTIA